MKRLDLPDLLVIVGALALVGGVALVHVPAAPGGIAISKSGGK